MVRLPGTFKFNQAIEEYKFAQLFNADRPESLANLASLYAQQAQTQQAESLGLLLVRQKKLEEAIEHLHLATASSTATDRYVYIYAVALNSSGDAKQALKVLEQAQHQYPGNTDILYALLLINRDLGDQERAQYYENILRTLIR